MMPDSISNGLLKALSSATCERLLAGEKPILLPSRMPLYEDGTETRFGYFLNSGMASAVIEMNEGDSAEVAIVGREGLVGAMQLLGPAPPVERCLMQMPGEGYRIPMRRLQQEFLTSDDFRAKVLEFVQSQQMMMGQIAACNRLHEAEARLARWLLMCGDRVDDGLLPLTQEFLAEMLGTRRTTVAVTAGDLQRRGLIGYKRGKVRIVDAEGLMSASCDCYRVIRDGQSQLYQAAQNGHLS